MDSRRKILLGAFLIASVAAVLAIWSYVRSTGSEQKPNQQQTAVPVVYKDLYSQLERAIRDYDKQISSAWDRSKYSVNYSATLLSANSNGGLAILQDNVREVMAQELDAQQSLGVKATTVEIGFPIFDANFYMFLGQSAAQAQESVQRFVDYYVAVAQSIHSRQMKLVVEANPLLTYYTGSASSLDASGYYKSLDVSAYEQRRSDQNILIAEKLKPDYMVLQSEPQTDAVNEQNPVLAAVMNDPKADADMIRYFVTQLDNANIPGLHSSIQLGSGVGTWQGNWQKYVSNLISIPGLDKIDCHIYNLQPGLDEIGVAMTIADMAHAAGKGASIAEFWLHKSTSLSGLTSNGDPLLDVRARDTFSFWSPLDEEFIQVMAKLANYKHFDYINAFSHYYWFGLIEYDSLTPPCPPVYPAKSSIENAACDSKIQSLQNQGAKQALADHQISPTGAAYRSLIATLSTN